MAIRKSASSGIPFGNTAGRPAAPGLGQLYSNGEEARLELYTNNGWQNIVQETPSVISVSGTYLQSSASSNITITGTNYVSGALAYAVGTNDVEYAAASTTVNSSNEIVAAFSNLSPLHEPYGVKVINPSNLYGLLPAAFYVNDTPVWTTASGSLGSVNAGDAVSKSVAATDDETQNLTYAIASGSLPPGLSLNTSTGAITGTVSAISSNTTYTFSITVSDGGNSPLARSFNIPVVAVPIVSGGTLSSDTTYLYRTFSGNGDLVVTGTSLSADVLVVAGGGGGGSAIAWTGSGGGGAGSILYKTAISCLGTYPVTVGAGGAARNSNSFSNGTNGGSSSFNAVTALGGGGGGNGISFTEGFGASGGSGGGGPNGQPSGQDYGSGHYTGSTPNAGRPGGSAQSSVSGWTLHANVGGAGAADNAYNVHSGGGGGGAGQSGNTNQSALHLRAGDGGDGVNTYSSWASATSTGLNGYYGGGGGGGTYSWPSDPSMTISDWSSSFNSYIGHSGLGGGGRGGIGSGALSMVATNATALTGGGGGGGGYSQTGASGGSGVVIVRYLKSAVGL